MTEADNDKEYTARQFKDQDYKGVVFVQEHVLCNLQDKAGIPSSWMLLDNQYTVDVLRMLSKILDMKST